MLLEPLEPRLLLSSQPLAFAAAVASDLTLRLVDDVGTATLELVDNTAATPESQVIVRQALADTSAVEVEGSDDADRLAIDDSVPVELPVKFTGRHGLDKLLGRNVSSLWRIAGRDAGQVDSVVEFSEVEDLTGGAGADTFIVTAGASLSGVLDSGAGSDTLVGGDTDNAWVLSGADAGTLNDLSFSGIENVTGGAGTDTFVVTVEASLSGVLDGGEGSDTLVGADTDSTWTITEANAGTLDDLSFVGVENLTGGAGDDTFVFLPGGGLDGVIAGGAGIDTLQGADTANTWVLTGAGAGTLNGQAFTEIENLVGGADTDLFVFAGGSVSGTIDGGGGDDVLDYSTHASDVTVDVALGAATATGGFRDIASIVGSAGSDTLVGADASNTWTITGLGAGTVGNVTFSGVENLAGGDLDDTLVFLVDGGLDGLVTGGLGADTLVGADEVNTWEVTEADTGRLNGVAFSGIESLLGGAVEDAFVFGMVGRVSGLIDGRAGRDRVRGADKRNRWKVTGTGNATLDDTSVAGVEQLEGGNDQDELVGPDANTTWTVTGPDSGDVAGVSFSGMENLTGAADNEDTFVVEAGGAVSGVIEGGAGGFDSLRIAEGGYSTIIFEPTGPDSGSISLDGTVIQYAGLEPVVVDSDPGTNVLFDLTSISGGDFTLDHSAADTFTLTENNGAMESATFTDPGAGGTVTINLGSGDDTITLQNLLGAGDGTTLNAHVIITGGAGGDTYVLDDKWGPNVTLKELVAHAGTDTLDFGPYSDGGNTITIAPQLSGAIVITGVGDGSALTLDATDNAFDDVINAEVDLTGSLASVKTELVQGLEKIVTFVRNLAASGDFLTDLPVIGKNADVTISKALDFAEALDEIRFQVEEFFDGLGTLTTQDLIDFLDDKFLEASPSYVGALEHLGAAIFAAKPIVDADIATTDIFDFKLTVDGVEYHVVVDVDASPVPSLVGNTVTVGFNPEGGADDATLEAAEVTVANLLSSLNLGINTIGDLAGQIGALARDGRLAFQVVGPEIDALKLEAGALGTAAATKLGLESVASGGFVLSSVQEILRDLGALNVKLDSGVEVAVSIEGGVPNLRFDVDYRADRTSDFFFDFGPEAQTLGLSFDVEAQIEAMAELVADLRLGLSLQDATTADFFLDVDALRAGISLTASAVADAGLNLGFIGLEANGSLALDAGLAVNVAGLQDVTDPGAINVGSLGLTLTDSAGTAGAQTFDINLTLTVDAGTSDIGVTATGTLTASGDPFDGSSITLNTDTNFDANFPDFNNLNSAGVISLLGQVSSWLDNLRDGELISSIDIPLIEGGLDKILDLAEVLSDALLFDEGADDVRDGADKLVTDLNAALDDANLGDLIRAQGDGGSVSFIAIGPDVTAFTVSKGPGDDDSPLGDGFEKLGITSGTAATNVDGVLTVAGGGPVSGNLLGKAVIRFSVARDGGPPKDFDVTVEEAATADNTGIGDDKAKLLDADNNPTFANAQELAHRLAQILTSFLPGDAVNYDPVTRVLTYDVSFTGVPLFSVELPIDFELDLSPVGEVESNTRLVIDATGGINFTLGFDLSPNPPASSGGLTDGTTFGSLDVPVTIKLEEAVSADGAPRTLVGQLSGDATFTISYNPTATVTVPLFTGMPGTDINVTHNEGDQSETSIAVNPVNPNNIIIGVNDRDPNDGIFGAESGPSGVSKSHVYVTINGGVNWIRTEIPVPAGTPTDGKGPRTHSDPTLVFSRDGSRVVYMRLVDIDPAAHDAGAANHRHRLASAVSFDGGLTWLQANTGVVGSFAVDQDADPALVGVVNPAEIFPDEDDKEYLAVGPDVNDPTQDRFVVAWQRNNVIYASTSTDGITWTLPVKVGGLTGGSSTSAPSGASIDSIPSFGPHGEIYVVWEEFATPGVSHILFDVSFDGGLTWGGGRDAKVFFGVDDSALDAGDELILDDVAAELIANPQLIVTVAGYASTSGNDGPNQDLSDDRADAVRDYLVDTWGIAPSRITVLGFGETQLAVPTLNGVELDANRRAEITFDQVIYTGNVNPFRDFAEKALITGATQANPVEITTAAPHGLTDDASVVINDIVGMTELNGRTFTVHVTGPTTFELVGENGTAHTAYVSGGTWTGFGSISNITQATPPAPVVITTPAPHGLTTGDQVGIVNVVGMTELNQHRFTVTVTSPTSFTLDGEDATAHTAYVSGGDWQVLHGYEVPAQPDRGLLAGLSIDVDRSDGANDGRIYVAFIDQGDLDGDFDPGDPVDHADTDVFVIASDDLGTTWTALGTSPGAVGASQIRVNDDLGTSTQFFSWLAVDQSTGHVAISWYDARNDDGSDPGDLDPTDGDLDGIANNDVQYFAAISFDGAETWIKNIQVSDGTSTGTGNDADRDYDDYTSLAFVNGTVHMAWADTSDSTTVEAPNPDGPASFTDTYYDRIVLTNRSFQDLLDDINAAFANTMADGDGPDPDANVDVLSDHFLAQAAEPGSNVLKIVAIDPSITAFSVTVASTADPAFRDLGLQLSSTAVEGSALGVTAGKSVPTIVGQLTADASFDIDLDGSGPGDPVTVTVEREDTVSSFASNRNILDLVFDVQSAVNAALGADVIKVSSERGRLLFTRLGTPVLGNGDEFTITPGANSAELGITTVRTSDEADLLITESDGVTQHRIRLDDVDTIGELITAISLGSSGAIVASKTVDDPNGDPTPVNEADTGLTITEFANPGVFGTTTSGGTATTLNDSGQDFSTNGLVQVGDDIFNLSDGSRAQVVSLANGSLTTTPLNGGTDNTWQSGDQYSLGKFRVEMVNGSLAAIQLGIIGTDRNPQDENDVPDGKIVGATIAGAKLLDRFFLSAPGATAADPSPLNDVLSASLTVQAARLVEDITVVDNVSGGTKSKISSASFDFSDAHVGKTIVIKGVAGFTAGAYTIDSVIATNVENSATLSDVIGEIGQEGGVGILKTGVDASATFGFVSIGLEGTADLGAELSWGFNTASGAPGADGRLTAQEVIDNLDDPLALMLVPDLTPIPVTGTTSAPGTATSLTDASQTFDAGKRVQVGDVIRNLTDGSQATIVSIDSDTQLTTTALTGGSDNTWGSGDEYEIQIRNFGVVDASVDVDLGGDLSSLATAIGAEAPRLTLRVLALGDPFLGTRFEQANYASGGGTTFTVDGDFTSKLPTGVTLRFDDDEFEVASAEFASGTTTVTVSPTGLPTDLSDVDDVILLPKVDVDVSDLGDILPDFSNLSFADIIAMLRALAEFLSQFETFGFLNEDIPVIDKSVSDLLAFAEEFALALDEFQQNPAGSLQVLEDKIKESLGIASSTLGDIFAELDAAGLDDDLDLAAPPTDVLDLSYDTTAGILKFDLVWGTSFSKGLDVAIPQLDFGSALSALGLNSLLDLSGSANLVAEGSVLARLTLGIDVAGFDVGGLAEGFDIDALVTALGDHLFVYDTTGLAAHLKIGGEDIAFKVGVGPFALSIGSTESETAKIELEGAAALGFEDEVFDPDLDGLDPDDDRVSFGELFDNLSLDNIDASLTGTIEGVLPVFFPNDAHQLGAIRIGGTDANMTFTPTGDLVKLVTNALGGGPLNFELISSDADPNTPGVQGTKADAIAIDVTDVIEGISSFDFSHFNIFDNIILAVDGLDLLLELVQDLIGGQNFSFPLVGDDLAKAAGFIGDLRDDFIAPLRDAIETAKDTAQDFSDPSKNIISKFLFQILGPSGVNLLLPHPNGGAFGVNDPAHYIALDTNLDEFLFDPDTTLELEDVFVEWDLNLGSTLVDESLDIGFDLGIPGLGLETEGDLTINIDWALDLAFGLNFKDGFFIQTDDPSELVFNVDVGLPAAITGTLGFLGLRGEDAPGGLVFPGFGTDPKHTGLGATFKVDVFEADGSGNPLPNNPLNPNEDGDRLGFTELGSIGFDFGVAAEAVAALNLTLGLSDELFVELFGPGAADVIAGFPTITGDFRFLWQLGNRATSLGNSAQAIADNPATQFVSFSDIGDQGFDAIAEGLKYVSIEDISLDLGTFISDVLGPIVAEVSKFTEPIQPLIDFITSPVPIIGQLGFEITWLDLAEMLIGDDLNVDLIRSIAEIITMINRIAELSAGGPVLLPIGDFIIYDPNPIGFAPEIWDTGLDLDQVFEQAKTFPGVIGNVFGTGSSLGELAAGIIGDVLDGIAGDEADIVKGAVTGEDAGGFSFPFLEHPEQIFGLLMGKNADLVAYDLGALDFKFEFHQFFSIFGPLGVSIGLLVQMAIDTAFVYDTQGIRDFVESGFRNPALLFNGFAIADDPKLDGVDEPELTFLAELQAAAELNVAIARAAVTAAFGFLIEFDLFDDDGDGRVRIVEMLGNILNQLRAPDEAARLLAPLAIFDVSGEIFARMFATLELGVGPFAVSFDFPIFGPVTLLTFEIDFFRPPILASELDNGDLLIHTGEFADQRLLGNATDLSEHIVINKTGTSGDFIEVEISSGGARDDLGEDSTTPLPFRVKKGGKIIIDGGQGDDYFQVTNFAPGDVLFEIDLGVGNDVVELTGGIDGTFSTIAGGAGDDTIGGSDGSDLIFGGLGVDDIAAGDGDDLVFGDEGEIGTDTATALVRPTDGADTIDGEGGSDILIGGGARDHIEGGGSGHPDFLVGGGGVLLFTPGAVKIYQNFIGIEDGGVEGIENLVLDTSAGDVLIGDGPDIIYGTAGPDVITGTSEGDVIFGMGGADVIDGAGGNDIIFGDGGTLDPGAGGSGTATDGDATTLTDSGAHFVTDGVKVGDYVNNETEKKFVRVTAVVSETTVETEPVGNWDGSAYAFFVPKPTAGTGDAPDTIQGGAGDDLIFGGGGGDYIQGGDDDDRIFGGSGPDLIFGDAGHVTGGVVTLDPGTGDDKIFGQGEPDKIYGGPGHDEIDGGIGSDQVFGGDDSDAIITNKGSDYLDGEEGSDGYLIFFQGGSAESFVQVKDSGSSVDVDLFVATGTVLADDILLRSNTDGSVAFVANINDPAHVERIEYNSSVERIVVNGSFGNDYFASDDTAAEITLNGEFGDDTFQIGQMFKSERTVVDANVSVDDVFATIETTRGSLSNGISKPMTINGGIGNDHFVVFHNKAVLQLNGEEGDDLFEIRAFALAGSQEPQRERTDISGGAGADLVQYVVNAPVNIDGGDGFDTVVIIGTEFGDDFVITNKGVFGAGLNVNFVNIEALRVDGAEGDDRFFVLSTSEDFVTEIFGGLGADTFNMSGATPPVVSNDLRGHSGVIAHEVESVGDERFDAQQLFGVSANVADNDEPFAVIRETEGATIITEGGTLVDSYQLVLTRQPDRDIFIKALAPIPTPGSRELRALSFRLDSPTKDAITDDGTGLTLRFTTGDWFIPQTVNVLADAVALMDVFGIFTRPELGDNAGVLPVPFDMDDDAYEGVRFGVINHLVQAASTILQGTLTAVSNGAGDPPSPTTVEITDPGGITPTDLFGRKLLVTEGNGIGQVRFIFDAVDNGATFTLTLDRPFLAADVPDTASEYFIGIDDAIVGKMTGFQEDAFLDPVTNPDDHRSTFTDSNASFPTAGEGLRGAVLEIIGGPGAGQQRLILGNDAGDPTHKLILNGGWRTNPVATQSIYRIQRYDGLAIPSVTVQINDDDRPGLIIDESRGFADDGDATPELTDIVPDFDTITAVIEDGDGDQRGEIDVIRVRLSTDPGTGNSVEVALHYDDTQFLLTDLSGNTIDDVNPLSFDDTNWDDFQPVLVYALGDGVREGFHSGLIEFEITVGSADTTVSDATDAFEPISEERAAFFVGLTQVPVAGSVEVTLNSQVLTDNTAVTFQVFSNKVVFFDGATGDPIAVSGDISVTYDYVQRGFTSAFTKPILARLSDSDAPTVLVRETGDSTDVVEIDPVFAVLLEVFLGLDYWRDSYELVLTGEPTDDVVVMVTPEITKTTRTGGIRHDAIQVSVSSSDPRAVPDGFGNLLVTFDDTNWDDPLIVTVNAVDDAVVDGSDTQVFPPHPNVVSGILGPVVVEGAGGRGTLAINAPLMLPGETNLRAPDGHVVDFTPNPTSEPGAIEQMTVLTADLQTKVTELEFDSLEDLIGLTIEMARGQGINVVLDPTRPRELFDRFWLINDIQDVADDPTTPLDESTLYKVLVLQNPSQLDVAALDPTAVPIGDDPATPEDESSQYAITALSANFFVDEKTQVDFMFVHDEDSPADHTGVLTPNRLYGLNMGPDLVIGGGVRFGGITYGDLEVVEINLGTGNNNFTVLGTPTREDGYQTWTFLNTGDDIVWNNVRGDTVTVRLNDEDEVVASGLVTAAQNADGAAYFTTTVTVPGTFANGELEGYVIRILEDELPMPDHPADGQVRRILGNVGNVLTVDRVWEFLPTGEAFEIVNEADGAFAANLQGGDDTLDASGSSLGIVVFGGLGMDTITGGSGDDIIFGDRGRVDYFNENDAIVTRLGDAPEPITGSVTTQVIDDPESLVTLVDSGASFPVPDDVHADGLGTDDIGLRGLYVDINNGFGFLQPVRLIADNTATTLTLAEPFDTDLDLPGPVPGDESEYRISTIPEDQTDGVVRDPFLLITVDSGLGDADTIDAGGGDDQVFGGAGGDDVMGGGDDDVVIGDAGRIHRSRDPLAPEEPGFGDVVGSVFDTLNLIEFTLGGPDTMQGGSDDDLLIGGAFGDFIDGDAGDDLIFGDTVQLTWRVDLVTGETDITDPRFRTLGGTRIYSTPATNSAGADLVDGNLWDYRDPDGTSVPAWAPWLIQNLYHTKALQDAPNASFGDDYIAGGADHDVIFGQLGNDTIQGDGAIESAVDEDVSTPAVGASRDGSNALILAPSFEAATDGDDYIEGNGGNDVIFGGLGQDDLIGGSSDLFTLDVYDNSTNERPDGADLIFGGSGQRAGRNAEVNGPADPGPDDAFVAERHARDADVIVSDNGDIFRLVGVNGTLGGGGVVATFNGFLAFNYDVNGLLGEGYAGTRRIIARAARLLDYTPGGPDFTTTVEPAPADIAINPTTGLRDIGAADEVHGESGDDFIYGMVGGDVLFGDAQDDDVLGGYGNDWISGGTGDDGILGDDGRIFTSRNGFTEPLTGLATPTVETLISTPGNLQQALIYVTGTLQKKVDLTPFSVDPDWDGTSDEFGGGADSQHRSDDIIFGGLGDDSVHGGSGEDAISGAEALPEAYLQTQDAITHEPNGTVRSDFDHPYNPGNALFYDPLRGAFAAYDEYNPLRRILLNNDGTLSESGSGKEFFLNFSETDGPLVAVGSTIHTDGDDAIFGDLGNDWIVGGTGRDRLYGGWGNDLTNADDDLSTAAGVNDAPDTDPSYNDIAYGGAGLDVLIGNTGGDRLIDWVGEYNSYLVPFSPFGLFTVVRLVQPQLPEYLYDLSEADGADQTLALAGVTGTASGSADRNGEPYGELGVVTQQDAGLWQDQTGAPRDPQPGNTSSQKRDILGKTTFDTSLTSFAVATGTWSIENGRYVAAPSAAGGVSLYDLQVRQPAYYEVVVTMNVARPGKSGLLANGYIVFDYQSATDFKFAGIDAAQSLLQIGHRSATGWVIDAKLTLGGSAKVATGQDAEVKAILHGTVAGVEVNGAKLTHTFADELNDGYIGLGANNSSTAFDSWQVQQPPTATTFTQTTDFSDPAANPYAPQTGTWIVADGVYSGTAAPRAAALATRYVPVIANSRLDLHAEITSGSSGGLVFDYYGPSDYKFVAIVAGANQVVIGHVTTAGTVIDASVTRTVTAGTTYVLGISLNGSRVSVSLNGNEVGGHTYLSLLNDGKIGLLSEGGSTTFDNVKVSGDDPAYLDQALPQLASTEGATGTGSFLTTSALAWATGEAIEFWAAELGDSVIPALRAATVQIVDQLPGAALARTVGDTILMDATAAGWGWFVGPTPSETAGFIAGLRGRMDLLTVVTHELGHVLGLEHGDDAAGDTMEATLAPGVRRLEEEWLTASQAEQQRATGSTNGTRALAFQEVTAFSTDTWRMLDATPRRDGVRPLIDWDAGVGGHVSSLSPYGERRAKAALRPLFPAFDDAPYGDRADEEAQDAALLPSTGWEWQVVEAGVSSGEVNGSEGESAL